jgi:hypothetical protein
MNIKGILDKFVNDLHVPIAIVVFVTTTAFHFKTSKDLGPGYVNSLYAFYGFLGAHFGCSQKWPDPPQGPTTGGQGS